MSFQNYSSADFINGQSPNPPVVRGRPRANPPSAAQIPTDVPVPTPSSVPASSSQHVPSAGPVPVPSVVPVPSAGPVPATEQAPPAAAEPVSAADSVPEPNTTLNWDSPSTHVLIEIFPAYLVEAGVTSSNEEKAALIQRTEKAFNDNAAVNGRRDICAMTTKWHALHAKYRSRRDDANSTGSAPLQHWEFHDLMEQATIQMPITNPPVTYSSHSRETVDNRGDYATRRRGRSEVVDDEDEDVAPQVNARRPRNVSVSMWFMANHMEQMEAQSRAERAADRARMIEERNADRARMAAKREADIARMAEENAYRRVQLEHNNDYRRQNTELLREATLSMSRMVDLFAASIAHNNNATRAPNPTTTTSNNNPPSPNPSTDNII
ncbi:hypothetical protein INT47_003115 [Mucor saturninus]|uniref:Uncharacterized protein n=1 Tax=Mucor saturninus TaxID=64648 RepID=A0A8H7QI19_9FUNG|nr:hypothetical protein INT47_003115 [Mucor saturninus]